MKIDIITLFPEMFDGPFKESILKRAQQSDAVKINVYNLRDWATDKHHTVDDRPYGGGAGMLLKVDVIDRALEDLRDKKHKNTERVILLDATGKTFKQQKALELSKLSHLILIAGHYEGVDFRVHKYLVDEVISIGDFVLTGGEIPTMALVDSIVRLIPGVIEENSLKEESFSKEGFLEYPQYTRPDKYKTWDVPTILKSGNHAEIEKWKKKS